MRVIYTRLLFWADGTALTPTLILIRPERRGDAGLLAHERVHCEQLRREGTLRFWWHYITDRSFRLASEVEAYKISVAHKPDAIDRFAASLSERYCLRITRDEAARLLRGGT